MLVSWRVVHVLFFFRLCFFRGGRANDWHKNQQLMMPPNWDPNTFFSVFLRDTYSRTKTHVIFKQGLTRTPQEPQTAWIDVYLLVLKHVQKSLKNVPTFLDFSGSKSTFLGVLTGGAPYDGHVSHVTFYDQGAPSSVCPSTSLTKTTGDLLSDRWDPVVNFDMEKGHAVQPVLTNGLFTQK